MVKDFIHRNLSNFNKIFNKFSNRNGNPLVKNWIISKMTSNCTAASNELQRHFKNDFELHCRFERIAKTFIKWLRSALPLQETCKGIYKMTSNCIAASNELHRYLKMNSICRCHRVESAGTTKMTSAQRKHSSVKGVKNTYYRSQ